MKNVKKMIKRKGGSFSVRFFPEDEEKFKTACHRDMIQPSSFAEMAILKAVDRLIEKQRQDGYQCMLSIAAE
jgi:hypothetical protein